MDSVRDFHHQRIRDLLIRSSKRKTAAADPVIGEHSARTDPLQIPELLMHIVECIPPRYWPSMCLVSRLWCQTLQPLLWRHISFHTDEDGTRQAGKLSPFLYTLGQHIHTLNFALFTHSRAAALILKELSTTLYPALTSLRLQELDISTEQLADAIQHLPRLRAVNLKYTRLTIHPLNLLAQHSLIESIAFTQDDVPLDPTHANIFQSWPYLKDLCITGMDDFEAIGPTLLLQELIAGSSLQLQSLELEDLPSWSEATVSHLIANSPNMQKLWLDGCKIPEHHLATTPPASLVSLQILSEENTPEGLVAIMEANPRLRLLHITQPVRGDLVPGRLAAMCPALEALRLHESVLSATSPVMILKNFPQLRRLYLHDVHVCWSDLCFDDACQLEELTLDPILLKKEAPQRTCARGAVGPRDAFWSRLGRLTKLRRLELNFLNTHLTRLPEEVYQIQSLTRLEYLRLMGVGSWSYDDVRWLAESLVDLEEMRCSRTEMSTPLWSWLRTNRRDLHIVIS
ncbi:hypothetical protein BGZ68_002214 [Mortierella alpina]|nr:hypothetical protein BGZ68_002214 [Mortierella alpina]